MLADQSLRGLLAAFASPAPTPAGGSASALASAVGVSLLMMAASLARSRTGSAAEREALALSRDALVPLQQGLTTAVDLDHQAYRQLVSTRSVSAASRLSNHEADEARQRALRRATDVPLEVMRMSLRAMQHALTVAAHCHRPASSDVRVAIGLIRAGLAGARSSAQDNLVRMTHGEYAESARAEIEHLSNDAAQAADDAERSLLAPA